MPEKAPALRQGLQARFDALHDEYREWEPHFRELRDHIMPRRGRFALGEARTSSRINKKIIDATARDALRTMQSGLHAGVTSPNRKWFKLGLLEPDAMASPETKEWLHVAEMRMYEVMRASNLYRMFPIAYGDLGLYGAHCSIIVPDFENVVHAHSFVMGEYVLGEDKRGRVDQVHRRIEKNVASLVQEFGIENVSPEVRQHYENNRHGVPYTVHHAIEPRLERDPLSRLASNAPWGVYYWEEQTPQNKLLQVSGYQINRVVAPRWDVQPDERWGFAPAMDALGDAAALQDQHVDKAIAIKKSYDPPLQGPAPMAGQRYKTFPGGITYLQTTDFQKGGLRPVFEVKPDISGLLEDMEATRERIRGAFYADLFQMFMNLDRRQITAEEIIRRYEEKVLMLGPVLERLNNELLGPVIDIVFHDMVAADLLPPAPPEISGQEIKVEYVSMLHQAQKAAGVQAMERTIGFVGSLGQIKPGALDMLDEDAMVREFVDQVGPPPSVLRGDKDVAAIRQQRAQQEQAAMAMESAEPMANAARLISEAAQRGQPGV